MSIKVNNLTKRYGQQKALDSISFEVQTGEIAGFIGPNGAGKSTTMKILTGFIPPNGGEAFVNGMPVAEQSMEVRKTLGYLPEHNPLYLDMYIAEYLEYVAGIYGLGKEKQKKIGEIIALTGLEPERKKKIGALSKGYRQRVGLAQALIHDPKVLILDEPTSGLDPNQIIEIRNLISSLGKEKTVLLSTHIMQEVEAICDKIIVINKGQIVADDTVANIHTNGLEKQQKLIIEFSTACPLADLEALEGVEKAVDAGDQKYILRSEAGKDIRETVFSFAVKNNYPVLSMQEKEKSLEELFQELTTG